MTDMKQFRIRSIDGIRGLSLLGILLANMLIFQYGMWGKDEMELYSLNSINHIFYLFTKIAVEGSFMPIFTFLFGYSMIKMNESLKAKGLKTKRYFVRRYIMLLAFGILHGTFLWEGDILAFYGMVGFFLLLFLNRKRKTIFIWAIVLLFLIPFLGYGNTDFTGEEKAQIIHYVKTTIDVYGSGSYAEIMAHRDVMPLDFPPALVIFMLLLIPFVSAPLFLFGMYAAKINMFTEPNLEKKQYLVGAMLIPAGLLLKSSLYIAPDFPWSGVLNTLGASLLALGYIFAFSLMYAKMKESIILRGFESVGKLSLTNYLLQSVICTTIFYGYGFGLFGKLGIGFGIVIAVFIYILQMIASYYYLKIAKIGPIEILLRMWTNFSFKGNVKEKLQLKKEFSA
ncbi:DUF418 domain-containing protein [Metabacillus fastidiosus]|uniref:DUF418 domain-containing protein n=1 Tax=Metabacillus fastidiosus TaxID=1458 RepID=UPI002E21840B|nr:DUF418 domain-containing protein [Metabacillus fastidiosus]